MNHREPPRLPAAPRKALHCLALLLLPALAPHGAHALPRSRPHPAGARAVQTPYLPVTGAPLLRFQPPAPPPDLATRPAAAAPPTPSLTPTESSVAMTNAAAARSAVVSETPPGEPATARTPEEPAGPDTPAAPGKTPPPILHDSVRPTIRPEDFLPYFQIPGSARHPADVTLLVPAAPPPPPAPGALPPSSATYSQTPK